MIGNATRPIGKIEKFAPCRNFEEPPVASQMPEQTGARCEAKVHSFERSLEGRDHGMAYQVASASGYVWTAPDWQGLL